MTKKKNHSQLSPSDPNRWMNCPGIKNKPPKFVLYGKGGIGKTSFMASTSNPIIIQSTEEKKK
jgi:hypothetical protein